jgi:hypothetical protein
MALPLSGGRFHLDDVRAHIAHALRRERPGHSDGAIENANAA